MKKLRTLFAQYGLASAMAAASWSVLVRAGGGELVHHVADGEARRLGARREFLEALDVFRDQGLRWHEQERPVCVPVGVQDAVGAALERIGPQVVDVGRTQ